MESPEIHSNIYCQLIFSKECQNNSTGEISLFNQWFWDNWGSTRKIKNLNPVLTSHTKINTKWMKNLNVRPETIKVIGRKQTVSSLTCLGDDYFSLTPKVKVTKAKVNKQDYSILKKASAQPRKPPTK